MSLLWALVKATVTGWSWHLVQHAAFITFTVSNLLLIFSVRILTLHCKKWIIPKFCCTLFWVLKYQHLCRALESVTVILRLTFLVSEKRYFCPCLFTKITQKMIKIKIPHSKRRAAGKADYLWEKLCDWETAVLWNNITFILTKKVEIKHFVFVSTDKCHFLCEKTVPVVH